MNITLRDASAEDEAFLREVYASTRAQELSLVPWDEAQREAFLRFQFDAQHFSYRDRFPEATYQVLLSDGDSIGRLYIDRKGEEIKILDLTVLPQHRNRGIGTSLMRDLLSEGARAGR